MEVTLYLFLFLSLLTNVILSWYCIKIVRRMFFGSEYVSNLIDKFSAYRKELLEVYELQKYYGDQDLKILIEHTTEILSVIGGFDKIYSFTQPDLEDLFLEEEEINEDENEETRE